MSLLETLLTSALSREKIVRSLVEQELQRLLEGGYLEAEDVARLQEQALTALQEHAERASKVVKPAISGLAGTLRAALDIPSRTEILELTEALRRAEAARARSEET